MAPAGAAGALARWGATSAVGSRAFPWATLGVNVVGSLLLGVVIGVGQRWWSADVTLALGVGFLGAFTTFSTFSTQVDELAREGRWLAASTYVVASVALGVLAAVAGRAVASTLLAR